MRVLHRTPVDQIGMVDFRRLVPRLLHYQGATAGVARAEIMREQAEQEQRHEFEQERWGKFLKPGEQVQKVSASELMRAAGGAR